MAQSNSGGDLVLLTKRHMSAATATGRLYSVATEPHASQMTSTTNRAADPQTAPAPSPAPPFVLDTRAGDPSETLYRSLGWQLLALERRPIREHLAGDERVTVRNVPTDVKRALLSPRPTALRHPDRSGGICPGTAHGNPKVIGTVDEIPAQARTPRPACPCGI